MADTGGGAALPASGLTATPGTLTGVEPNGGGSFADGGGGGYLSPYVPGIGAVGGGGGGGGGGVIVQTPAVPEPGTWGMMVCGLAALAWIRYRRTGNNGNDGK